MRLPKVRHDLLSVLFSSFFIDRGDFFSGIFRSLKKVIPSHIVPVSQITS